MSQRSNQSTQGQKPTSAVGQALTKQGQHQLSTQYCIACEQNGQPCCDKKVSPYVPYCIKCFEQGDPSLQVLPHPRFGKMLIQKRDLPEQYRIPLFGKLLKEKDMEEKDMEWGFETHNSVMINPCLYKGSLAQYSQCPGPNERTSLVYDKNYLLQPDNLHGKLSDQRFNKITEKHPVQSMMFATSRPVSQGYQLNMIYDEGEKQTDQFFEEKGLERCDVYCDKGKTFLKKNRQVADLKLKPGDKKIENNYAKRHEVQKSRYSTQLKKSLIKQDAKTGDEKTKNLLLRQRGVQVPQAGAGKANAKAQQRKGKGKQGQNSGSSSSRRVTKPQKPLKKPVPSKLNNRVVAKKMSSNVGMKTQKLNRTVQMKMKRSNLMTVKKNPKLVSKNKK